MNMRQTFLIFACMVVTATCGNTPTAVGFQGGAQFEVTESVRSIDLITGSSRRLKFGYNVPELMVENPDVIQATPVAPDEVLISGLKPGISTLTISDPKQKLQTITINVVVDTRPLRQSLEKHFPDSQINVDALQTGVIVSGYVARADQVENVMLVARDYFPTNVINQLQVQGTQNIAIKVKVYEVSRTKLRQLGVDWSAAGPNGGVVSSISGLIQSASITGGGATGGGQNITAGVLKDGNSFDLFIQALEQRNVARLLDEPVLIAQNGRPAEFLSGGEIPIQVAAGLGANAIEFRPFGTKLDIVPIVQGQGQLTLEVRAEVSEIANELAGDTGVPGFRVRRVNTGVKMKAGHTLALAGDYREASQSETRGIPKLMDTPLLGSMFRKVEEVANETELVFLITPRFISEVEPHQVGPAYPGQLTSLPSDRELFINGHLEVPKCADDCPVNDRFNDAVGNNTPAYSPMYQNAPMQGPVNDYNAQPNQFVPGNETSFREGPIDGTTRRGAINTPMRSANGASGFAYPSNNQRR